MSENFALTQPITVVTHEGGLRLVANARGHRVPTDQPIKAGGTDSAAMPLDLIGAALATCIGLAIVQFCGARQLVTEGLKVELWQQTARDPYRIEHYEVRVTLPDDFPERYRAAVGRAARTCAAFNTLTHQPTIQIDVRAASIPEGIPEAGSTGRVGPREPGLMEDLPEDIAKPALLINDSLLALAMVG